MGGNQRDALRASHLLASKKPMSSLLVGEGGLEPPSLSTLVPKTNAYTNSATRPTIYPTRFYLVSVRPEGIEPSTLSLRGICSTS